MNASELRRSILQMAVQGKLVLQDLHDKPATELLERIRQKKMQLIKERKIKKENLILPIREDEIPYDLPEGWVWCRISEVCVINPRNVLDENQIVSFVPMTLIAKEYFGGHQQEKRLWNEVKKNFTHFAENDIAVAKITPCFQNGKSCIMRDLIGGYGAGTTELHILRCIDVLPEYMLVFVKHPTFLIDGEKNMTGTAGQQRIPANYLANYLIPLPPLAEQQRIVAKISELMILCDKLEVAEKELKALENYFIEYLPKSILQVAVQGKLVQQDLHDESAFEFLKKIRKEREYNGKNLKNKKAMSTNAITEDEIPYDLPNGWIWCRLSDIGEIVGGATPSSAELIFYTEPGTGIAWITPADMKLTNNRLIYHGINDITQQGYDSCSTQLLPKGSVVFSSRAPIGHIAFAGNELCTNQGFKSVIPYNIDTNKWIYYCLISMTESITSRASGTTFKEVSGEFMRKELIPLPPFAEQQRIVNKIDELMLLCNKLSDVKIEPIVYANKSHIAIFPKEWDEEELLMVAQGVPSQKQSKELRQAIADLFGDNEDD